MPQLTVDETCKALGLKTYDTALPQQWFDAASKHTNMNPLGHVVWCYDNARYFGEPIGITPQGEKLVSIMKEIKW